MFGQVLKIHLAEIKLEESLYIYTTDSYGSEICLDQAYLKYYTTLTAHPLKSILTAKSFININKSIAYFYYI